MLVMTLAILPNLLIINRCMTDSFQVVEELASPKISHGTSTVGGGRFVFDCV